MTPEQLRIIAVAIAATHPNEADALFKLADSLDTIEPQQVTGEYTMAATKRDAGMSQVDEATDDWWKVYADEFIHQYLVKHPSLFVDDLWATGLIPPKSPRALGPRIAKAARNEWIRSTGTFRKSVNSNLSVKPVWVSLIYEEELV